MENLVQYNQYYQKMRYKFEQELIYTTIQLIHDYQTVSKEPLSNKKLHCLLFLTNAKRYENNLGFYKNDEIPEFEKWTLGYDAWDKGPIQTFIQKVTKKFKQHDWIGQSELHLLKLGLKSDLNFKEIRPIIFSVIEKYGKRSENELAKLISDFLKVESSLVSMRSFRKSRLRFEV